MGISKNIANYLIKEKGINSVEEQEILIYGAEVLLSTFFITIITLFIGYLLGLFHPLWIMLFASLIIRKTAGGAHSLYPLNCFLISLISYIFMSFIAVEYVVLIKQYLLTFITVTIIISSLIIIKKAPMESANKPIGIKQKRKLKVVAIFVLIIISIMQLVLYFRSFYMESFALSIVILWQSFMMMQLGYAAIAFLDNFYKIREVNSE